MREREGLIARVTQMRRAAPAGQPQPAAEGATAAADAADVQRLEARIAELEALVQGLQDSVHRESLRQRKRLDEMEARLEPSALAVALSRDARQRGI